MKRLTVAQWVGIGLGSLCGLLMLLMLAQRFGLGTGYQTLPEATEPLDMALLKPLKQSRHTLPPPGHYLQIEQRPLFNNDRRPGPLFVAKPTEPPPPPIVPLNATLTGTIVAQGQRMALVRDNTTSKVEVLKVGMSLPGELMGWKLVSIEPRSAIFDGGANQGRAELKLDVSKTTGPAPAAPVVATPQPVPQQQPQQANAAGVAVPPPPPPATPADQAAREEEVRRIIEERRAQMRAEAAKMGGG